MLRGILENILNWWENTIYGIHISIRKKNQINQITDFAFHPEELEK